MIEQGVKRGDLLFEGKIDGSQYVGTARIFKKGCDPIKFSVSGNVVVSEYMSVEGDTPEFVEGGCDQTPKTTHTGLVFVRVRS